jgi:hypothetical protein
MDTMTHSKQFIPRSQGAREDPVNPVVAAISCLTRVPGPKPWQAYTAALLATALATLLRGWLGAVLGPNMHPFITYYPMVMFAALFGGTGPGLLATVIASLSAAYLFLNPPGIPEHNDLRAVAPHQGLAGP